MLWKILNCQWYQTLSIFGIKKNYILTIMSITLRNVFMAHIAKKVCSKFDVFFVHLSRISSIYHFHSLVNYPQRFILRFQPFHVWSWSLQYLSTCLQSVAHYSCSLQSFYVNLYFEFILDVSQTLLISVKDYLKTSK